MEIERPATRDQQERPTTRWRREERPMTGDSGEERPVSRRGMSKQVKMSSVSQNKILKIAPHEVTADS